MGIPDSALWEKEFLRRLLSVKAALHSLQLQAADKKRMPGSVAMKRLAHTFETIDRAFDELNRPAPEPERTEEDFLPGPKGRRESSPT